jgi:hypothetical protein
VAQVKPRSGSALDQVWNEKVTMEASGQPLTKALTQLVQPFDVTVDFSQLSAGEMADLPITCTLREHPFRHLLGTLLYQARCRCELEGDTLVILPQQD